MNNCRACMVLVGCCFSLVRGAGAQPYWYPDAELMGVDFATEPWGSGELVEREDLPGAGVRLTLRLGDASDNGKTVVGDPWPVASTAGLAWDGGYLPNDPQGPHAQPHYNVDISAWSRIAMRVTYTSRFGEVTMRLFMNTGLTGPSAYPPNDTRNNSVWLSPLVRIGGGETKVLVLDFDDAEVGQATDNPWPHSGYDEGWADGTRHPVNERDRREITNFGLEAYGSAGVEISLDVDLPGSPPYLAIADQGADTVPTLAFEADDARDHTVQWSSDLVRWQTLTVLPCVVSEVLFEDPTRPRPARRYYRCVAPTNGVTSSRLPER